MSPRADASISTVTGSSAAIAPLASYVRWYRLWAEGLDNAVISPRHLPRNSTLGPAERSLQKRGFTMGITHGARYRPWREPVSRLTFRMLGVLFAVDSDIPGLTDHLRRLLTPFVEDSHPDRVLSLASVGDVVELHSDDDVALGSRPDAGAAIDLLLSAVTTEALGSRHPFVAIHAGGVVLDGAALVFPGGSGAGKSTLVAALVGQDFDLLSDEAVLIEPDTLLAHPFPRPFGLSPASMRLLGLEPLARDGTEPFYHHEHHVPPDTLRRGCLADPTAIRAVVVPRVSREGMTSLRRLSRSQGLHALASHRIGAPSRAARDLDVLAGLMGGVQAWELEMGSLDRAEALLRDIGAGLR